MTHRLNVVAWNTYTASHDDVVRGTLSAWAAQFGLEPLDAFALSEAASHADALRRWADKHGWTLLQESPAPHRPRGDDTGDCALLLAPHVTVQRDWVAVMQQVWMVVRYRRWHAPHRYQGARIKVRGHSWRLRASHWPTGGMRGRNASAWLESAHRSRRWLSRSDLPSIDVGDLNEHILALTDWYGPRFRVFGKGIDVAVTRRVAGCEWTELGKGGSDHHGRYYRFSAWSRGSEPRLSSGSARAGVRRSPPASP